MESCDDGGILANVEILEALERPAARMRDTLGLNYSNRMWLCHGEMRRVEPHKVGTF